MTFSENSNNLFTVGHSNQTFESFVELVRSSGVNVIVDVRSAPVSKYCPHFNSQAMKESAKDVGLQYVYLGRELGGMPKNDAFYDQDGNVDYAKIAASAAFGQGIERLVTGLAKGYRIALCCGEENPTGCHRRLLIARYMSTLGVEVMHIRNGGRLMSEEDLVKDELGLTDQLTLFSTDSLVQLKGKKST